MSQQVVKSCERTIPCPAGFVGLSRKQQIPVVTQFVFFGAMGLALWTFLCVTLCPLWFKLLISLAK